jgi:hypothetical protein
VGEIIRTEGLTRVYAGEARAVDGVDFTDHGHIVVRGTPDELKDEIRGDVVALTMPLQELAFREVER